MRYILIFSFYLIALFASASPLVVTENDPSTLVDGVSVITGDFYLGEEDYSVAAAEPISIRRFYLSSIGGINQYPHLTATFALLMNKIFINEPNGTLVVYNPDPTNKFHRSIGNKFYGKRKLPLKYHSHEFANTSPGISNTSTGTISAKSHLKNQTILFDPVRDKKGKSFSLYTSDGTIRRYVNYESQGKSDLGPHGEAYTSYYYKLVSEILPNGRVLHYEWDHKNRLTGMRTSNLQNNKTFAKVPFPKLDPKKPTLSYSLSGSDGRSISYIYRKTGEKTVEFTQVISPEQADQYFCYTSNRLSQISLPKGRTVAIQYDGTRVSALLAPIGPNGSLIPYYKFTYNPDAKTSSCIDALDNKTSYFWNNDYRLTRIDRFEKTQTHKNSETFSWEGTNLRCKVFYDETNSPLFAKTFAYDAKGNILEEIFWGNLSGRGPPLHIGSNGMPIDDGVEKAVTKNTYEIRNLLTRREDPSGLITEYTYLPHAQLPSSKILTENGHVFSKTTYTYDSDNTLIREVIEDGARVCKIQEIIPRQSEPYIGLPDIILEKCVQNGIDRLLKKTKLHYTTGALVSQKDVYDAEGILRYSLYYKYDAKGRVLEETNPLGQKSTSTYDEVGNRVFFKDPSGKKETFYFYDLANRLTQKIEKGLDGIEQKFLYDYDEKHNLVSETDPYGNTTLHEYDLFGNKVKTTSPQQKMRDGGVKTPITQARYDGLGNSISQIDHEGNETTIAYNVLAKPIRIIHPDGAIEKNVYNLDGTLALHIDPLGVETIYKYDTFGRVVEKRIEDAVESFIYDGSYLIEKTNAEEIKTFYRYDGAGRKISEEIAGEVVEFTYDSLGRINSRIEGELITSYQYDLLDRLIEEKKTNTSGALLRITQYEYDAAGNQTAVIQGKNSAERFEYDSLNRQISKIDPLGAIETTKYEIVQNDLDQKVLQKTTTDPLGLQAIEVFDAQYHSAYLEKKKTQILLIENLYYDLNGQKAAQEERIYSLDGSSRTILNQWEYDVRNRLVTLIEGTGSKITKYEYNLRGDKTSVVKPDGTTLSYEYNRLGHLIRLVSSDKTVDHRLEVDRLGRLVGFDGITRTLDPQGRVLEEKFSSGLVVKNLYDKRGRKIACSIPLFDLEIAYQHDPLDLEKVLFQNQAHTYAAYDLVGNVIEEHLIGHLGPLSRSYDSAQRPLSLWSSHFAQNIEEYDAVGNILDMNVDGVKQTYSYDELYQLTSETGPFCHKYTFDALYNRLSKDTEQYSLNALNQAISHCAYDLNGNPTQMGSMHLFYDALDRLIRVETHQKIQTFTYDYLNRCLSQTPQGGQPLFFLYDGQNEIGSFDQTLRNFRVLGRTETAEIGSAVAILINRSLYAPIHDLQGNISALIPVDRGPTSKHRYSAFGEENLEGSAISPWRFSSKRVDPATGFVNYGRRYYVPSLGRWLTPDPLGFTAGMNLYAFLQNDPLIHLDEYGLMLKPAYTLPREAEEATNRLRTATVHEVGHQFLEAGRFLASAPHYAERGWNSMTGRQNNTFGNWQEKQNQFFNKAEDWMYRALPADITQLDYTAYRRGVGIGLGIGSLAAGGYGLFKGGVKAARWGANAWKIRRGTYVAGEKLGFTKNTSITPVNFFKTRTHPEMEQLLIKKLGPPRGAGPHNKSFYNPKTKRTFNLHKDPLHHGGKAHVDIRKRGLPSDYYDPFFLKE